MGIIIPIAQVRNLTPRGQVGGPWVTQLTVWQALRSLHNPTELASQLECPRGQFIFFQKWRCSLLVGVSFLTIYRDNGRVTYWLMGWVPWETLCWGPCPHFSSPMRKNGRRNSVELSLQERSPVPQRLPSTSVCRGGQPAPKVLTRHF